jgi:hypothetical protein
VQGSEQTNQKKKNNIAMETRSMAEISTRMGRTIYAHLSKCAFADNPDRPEIPQTDLCPTEPQKL